MMKKNLVNDMRMFKVVSRTCARYKPVWETNERFVLRHARFMELFAHVRNLAEELTNIGSGPAGKKDGLQQDLVEKLVSTANILGSHLEEQNMEHEGKKLKTTKTALLRLNEVTFIAKCHGLLHIFEDHVAELEAMGVTAETIESLNEMIESYEALIGAPRQHTVNRRELNESLEKAVKDLKMYLRNQLDPLMVLFKDASPEFITRYKFSRVVVNLKARSGNHDSEDDGDIEGPERDSESFL